MSGTFSGEVIDNTSEDDEIGLNLFGINSIGIIQEAGTHLILGSTLH